MKSNEKPPLVTIALPAFRQESYIGQAIDSLLNQTYSNLEILISDDASPDGTFDIIKERL
ncbi:glycosyltransferase family 2 protein, partial [Solemya velum gill symbiont]